MTARRLLMLGGGGAVLSVAALLPAPHGGAAWLAAFTFWIGLPVGALALLMVHDLTGGPWGEALRGPLRAMLVPLPLLSLLLAPVLLALPEIYPWARGGAGHGAYLNGPFFVLRSLGYLALWNALALAVGYLRWRAVSAPGLALLAFTATFAAIDWMMSADAPWFSSVYGMVVGSGWMLTALATALLAAPEVSARGDGSAGNLLLAVVLFGLYVAFMQYLIVWEENLSREIPWYLRRLAGGWLVVALAALALKYLAPLALLLPRGPKRGRRGLATAAGIALAGNLLGTGWLLLPSFGGAGLTVPALLAVAGMGGLALAAYLHALDTVRRAAP